MGWYPCGNPCPESVCLCGETPVVADGTVSWFTHTVNEDGTITRNDHSGPCVTYYVDSVSGGGAETGSGTELDPWTNLNTVFTDTCIRTICAGGDEGSTGCPKVKVLVKGTIDYRVFASGAVNYSGNLVIQPWPEAGTGTGTGADARISITINGRPTNGRSVEFIIGVVWKNIDLVFNSTGNSTAAFYSCSYGLFDNCTVEINNTNGLDTTSAFYNCSYSSFNTVSVATTATTGSFGFIRCEHSDFKDCTATATNSSPNFGSYAYFQNDSGFFDTCDGMGSGVSPSVYGFYDNDDCSFIYCTGTGRDGWNGCGTSTFYECYGYGDVAGCGFASCGPTFVDCVGDPSGGSCDI